MLWAAMPEATVDVDRHACTDEDQVGACAQALDGGMVLAIPEAPSEEEPSYGDFSCGVRPPDSLHPSSGGGIRWRFRFAAACHCVRHDTFGLRGSFVGEGDSMDAVRTEPGCRRAVEEATPIVLCARPTGLTVVGLFAGIGGLEIGLERAGHQTELLCELLPEARAVLGAARRRDDEHRAFQGADITVDVTDSLLLQYLPERFDVLTAGFPCQDLSQAGRTSGIGGSRSGLIGCVFDFLDHREPAKRPTWVILENVYFMRHLGGGAGMEYVLSELSRLGYAWAYREIDTMAFGLPQRRRRIFIVACRRGEGDPRRVLLEDDVEPQRPSRGVGWEDGRACGFYWTEGNRGIGWADDAVPTLKGGSGVGIPSPPAIVLPPDGAIVLPTIRDAERLQGLPRGWTAPAAEVGRRADRSRWLLVGNAVSVPVAEWLGEGLNRAGETLERDDQPLSPGAKWPRAAWQLEPRGARFAAAVGGWPVARPHTPLLSILREEALPHPPLSLKAAKGFLRRFEASNLLKRNPEHRSALLEVLRRHVGHGSSH